MTPTDQATPDQAAPAAQPAEPTPIQPDPKPPQVLDPYAQVARTGNLPHPVNEYLDMIDQKKSEDTQALQQSVYVGQKTAPDQQAKILKLSDQTRLPPEIVARNYDEISKSVAPPQDEYTKLIDKNPGLAEWLKKPENASLAQGDMDALSGLERNIQDHSMSHVLANSLEKGLAELYAGAARIPALAYDAAALPQNLAAQALGHPEAEVRSPDWLRNNPIAKYYDRGAQAFHVPEMDLSITDEIHKGNYSQAGKALASQFVSSAPQQAALIVGMLSGYGIPAIVGTSAATAAQANEAAGSVPGVTPAEATTNALAKGAIQATFDKLGTFGILHQWEGLITKQYGKEVSKSVIRDFSKTLMEATTRGAVSQSAMSAANDLTDYVTGVNPAALDNLPSRAADAAVVGGATGSLMTLPGAVAGARIRAFQEQRAESAKNFYLAMGKSAEATKLRELLPSKQKELIASLTKNSPVENVYLPVQAMEAYFQSKNLDPVAEAQKIGAGRAYEEAKQTGGDVKIPLAQWADKVVGTEHYDELANDVKFDPTALTVNEQKSASEEAQAALEKADQAATGAEAPAPRPVAENVKSQLLSAGVERSTADQYAQLYDSAFRSLGERTGQDPMALFEKYGLKIERPEIAGSKTGEQVLNQPASVAGFDATDRRIQQLLESRNKRQSLSDLSGQKQKEWLLGEKPPQDAQLKVYHVTKEGLAPGPGDFVMSSYEHALKFLKDNLGGEGKVHEMTVPTSELFPAINPGGFAWIPGKDSVLFQGGNDGARGQIRFGANRQFNIDLLKGADLSTFLHETGHFYLEVLGDVASKADAPEQVKQDFADVMKWFGVESRDKIQTEHHEQFARGFEAYLMEGKAPTQALREAFARFRSWLVSIYQTVKSLNVELNPEVRGVFDRLVATDREIKEAETQSVMTPLFADPEALGMSRNEAARYMSAVEEAKVASENELSKKYMDVITREKQAWWNKAEEKVRTEITAEVDATPEYKALEILKSTDPDQPRLRLDRASISQLEDGKSILERLPRGITEADGVHPDMAAELLGFSSGDDLLRTLSTLEDRQSLIERMVKNRMQEDHGDPLFDPADAKIEAMRAVHNEKRSELYLRELKFMAENNLKDLKGIIRQIAKPVPKIDVIQNHAKELIARKPPRDINPNLYQRAEAKAGKAAVEAMLKGDFEKAFDEKTKQLLNHELYRSADSALEETQKIVDYAKSLQKTSARERIGKAGPEYINQIDSILERFEFKSGVSKKEMDRRATLVDWINAQRAMGFEPDIPPQVLNQAYKRNYKEIPFEQLQGIRDSVKNIEALARLKNKLLKNEQMRELDAAADEATASIAANSKGPRTKNIETRLPGTELARIGVGFFASHRKFASLIRQMDGFKDNGVLWNLLVRPMNEAGNKEAVAREGASIALKEIFDQYSAKEIKVDMYRKTHIPEINTSLSKMGQIMVGLNWGNLDNRQKLMDGQGWNESQVRSVLDHLDARDWNVIQSVWNHIDSYWAESKAISERTTGLAPEKVQAVPVETKHGTFDGGYFPLKYDDRQAPRAYLHVAQEAAERAMHGAAIRATTAHGHRMERVEGVKMPIRLDFGVIFEHISQVIHDQTHYEYLVDTNRILGDKRIQSSMLEHYGDQVYHELRSTVSDVASGDVPAQNSFEKAMNWLRAGSSISTLGWNLMTSLQQPLQLTQSMVRIGPKYVARGISRWIGDASRMESTVKWVHDQSEFMRLRHKTQQREIHDVRNQLTLKNELISKAQDSYFWLIGRGQMVADIPTWLGAYEKALDENPNDEKTAIALADQTVLDTQGGGQVKDLAGIQRGGPLLKLWTNFYSFFNLSYNLTAESVNKTNFRNPKDVGRLGVDLLMLYTVPAILGMALKDAFRGGHQGESSDDYLKRLMSEQAGYVMGSMVGVREIGAAVQGFHGYEGPPGTRFFSEMGNFAKQAAQGEADEGLLRATNKTAGILFHYPAGQVEKTLRGYVALHNGDTSNIGALLTGPPPKQ